jgi:hypothetical protein
VKLNELSDELNSLLDEMLEDESFELETNDVDDLESH